MVVLSGSDIEVVKLGTGLQANLFLCEDSAFRQIYTVRSKTKIQRHTSLPLFDDAWLVNTHDVKV